MKAFSLDNAIIDANNAPPMKEKFTIDFSSMGIDIDASVFLGINTETPGNLEVKSMLHSINILPFILSTIDDAKFTGLSMSVSDITPPKLYGFIYGGIDHLMYTWVDALFETYEKVIIKAMPNFFEMDVHDMVNEFIDDALNVCRCPSNEDVELDNYVDFRDLFLPSAESALAGGLGNGRHGNVIPWVMNIIEDQLFSSDDSGMLAINDMIIAPLTKSQSGMEEALKLNRTLFDYTKEEVMGDI